MLQIGVINQSTVLTDDQVRIAMVSLQKQLDGDFAPLWGLSAKLTFYVKPEPVPVNIAQMIVADDSDAVGALGYHQLSDAGVPQGFVFVKTAQSDGVRWEITLGHETLEMVADPFASLASQNGTRLYALEDCDACEADEYGYTIDGVPVSDFVTPAWFGMYQSGTGFDFRKQITAPFQLLPGGYIGILDLGQEGWQQLMAQKFTAGMRDPRPMKNPFSRRARRMGRKTPRANFVLPAKYEV